MCASGAGGGPCSRAVIGTVSAPAPDARRKPRRLKSISDNADNGNGAERSHIGDLRQSGRRSQRNGRAMTTTKAIRRLPDRLGASKTRNKGAIAFFADVGRPRRRAEQRDDGRGGRLHAQGGAGNASPVDSTAPRREPITTPHPRDMIGYGATPPPPQWPLEAREQLPFVR